MKNKRSIPSLDLFGVPDYAPDGNGKPDSPPMAAPMQMALFAAYTDIQRKLADRYREPTIIDALADMNSAGSA